MEKSSMEKQNTWKHQPYNGWSNWFTWNIALWLHNDYHVSQLIAEYSERQHRLGRAMDYDKFLTLAGIEKGEKTPDGVAYHSPNVNRQDLRELLAEG